MASQSPSPGSGQAMPLNPVQARLESLLLDATNPHNTMNKVNVIKQFCDTVAMSSEGPLLAARLLGHRIQSPQDQEALQALAVLEATVKSCGPAFHGEVGKFRFLNEMIKLVSPKYLGGQRPEHVKQKVVELLYCWTREIPGETKIGEAYQKLKDQGVVGEDPEYVTSAVFAASLPPRQAELDQEQEKRLQQLLHSKSLEDIQTANMMIKSLVSKDEEKMEKLSKRLEQLATVSSSVKLLNELLDSYSHGRSSGEERELLGDLCSSCEKLRPGLYRLASEVAEEDDTIGEILAASDDLTKAIERYREEVVAARTGPDPGPVSNTELLGPSLSPAPGSTSLLDLDPLSGPSPVLPASPVGDVAQLLVRQDILLDPLDQAGGDLMAGCLQTPSVQPSLAGPGHITMGQSVPALDNIGPKKGFQDLDLLGESLIRSNLGGDSVTSFDVRKNNKMPLNSIKPEVTTDGTNVNKCKDLISNPLEESPLNSLKEVSSPKHDISSSQKLDASSFPKEANMKDEIEMKSIIPSDAPPKWEEIHIEMAKIQPNKDLAPLKLQAPEEGLSVALHFTTNSVSGWPQARVLVATFTSRLPQEVTGLHLRPVLPRGWRVRALPPSATSLPPFSPFTPPPAATQVLLLAGAPSSCPPTVGYVLTYTVEGETVTDIGKDLPLPAHLWPTS